MTASSSLKTDAAATSLLDIESVITNSAGLSPVLTCSGGGTITLSAQNTFNGAITVAGAGSEIATVLQLGTNNAVPAGVGVTLNGGSGTTGPGALDLNGFSETLSNLTFSPTAPNYGYVTNSASGTTGTLTLGAADTSETLQYGNITDDPTNGGTVALAKIGTGVLTLASADTYSDNTTISAGTLALAGSGAIPNSAEIIVAAGATCDVSQVLFDLGTNQVLTGGGTVNGSMQADGTIAPTGTLTFNGALTFDGNLVLTVNKSQNPSNSMVAVINGNSVNNTGTGTLLVHNIGPTLAAGDTFTLFNQPLSGGDTLSIIPPPGVVFTNTLAANGAIRVLSVSPPVRPHILGITMSAANVIINGTNGVAGEFYHVLTSTNVSLPLASWTVLSSGSFTGSTFNITNTVNPSAPQGFYLLRVP